MLLTAEEAAARLGISKRTLYAYVSRGLVPSVEGPGRERRYPAAAVDELAAARAYRRAPLRAAREALDFGPPLLVSTVTSVARGRFAYRGHDALTLAATRGFEAVCALLWLGDLAAPLPRAAPPPLPPGFSAAADALPTLRRFEVLLAAADAAAEGDGVASGPAAPRPLARAGIEIVELLVRAAGAAGGGGVAERLARVWAADGGAAPLLDAALVLLADHELTPAALAARCAASVGASPYGAVRAGLTVLAGPGHAGRAVAVAGLFDAAARPAGLWETIRAHRRSGRFVPGFGHRLYPEGDPRARRIHDLLETHRAETEGAAWLRSAYAAASVAGAPPAVDLALVALGRALALPAEAPRVLFAVARTAGLVAHAGEQYGTAAPIRPRAEGAA